MPLSADRISGLFFFFAGLIFYLYVIPTFVEEVSSGSLHPDTLPNALSLLIATCGLVVAAKPTKHELHGARELFMAAVYFVLVWISLFAMTFFGYAVVSPVLALILMLLIGERWPGWLFSGAVIMPALIWFLVEIVLERGLP
ncbi:tripartite tricarboxylate transporter TctB family protein [Phaeobacter sp. J2-8]|uniref:tripartite tricarboxylate transporter TctB family protein n=1 Tax=Phaeobacter sp. J2-8 TaxID=2931394 RepID=UPI001FD552EC|nr:tripartite tricarboxylate transporter TctB family protein [Phaeobacter sp. J2-8]MCJ7871287.1 tripartite tricarboxylate transporter TctB family protein [Phaeobacter sp. J2-8]